MNPIAAQLDLIFSPDKAAEFRLLLERSDWITRREICTQTGWSEREVRAMAEALGSEVVRGQKGFKLASKITREEIGLAVAAADAFISQGKGMVRYGIALKNYLHRIL